MEFSGKGRQKTRPADDDVSGEDIRNMVMHFEQDVEAGSACIQYHGNSCAVCGFRYDNLFAEEYLQVHYIAPLETLNPNHILDPVTELRPICAYCHELLHTCEPPLSIEELKILTSNQAS